MISKKWVWVTAVQLALLLALNTSAMAGYNAVIYNDGLTTGVWNGPNTATVDQVATAAAAICCDAVGGGSCWQATIDKSFLFSYQATITLPEVGKMFNGALIDQTFHDSTKVHEDWHDKYAQALYSKTFQKLENWSKTYKSNLFQTEAQAIAAANADLANALTKAKNAFSADFSTDTTNPAFGHQNAVAVQQMVNGVLTWRSQNPNWGAAAVRHANGINITFDKTAGNCQCVPEPSTLLLLSIGVAGCLMRPGNLRRQALAA